MTIKALWRRMFPTHEMRLLLAQLRTLNPLFDGCPMYRQIETRVRHEIFSSPEDTAEAVRNGSHHPKHLALLLIVHVVGDQLSSGQFHKYRNVPNVGGQMVVDVLERALEELVADGAISSGFRDTAIARTRGNSNRPTTSARAKNL